MTQTHGVEICAWDRERRAQRSATEGSIQHACAIIDSFCQNSVYFVFGGISCQAQHAAILLLDNLAAQLP